MKRPMMLNSSKTDIIIRKRTETTCMYEEKKGKKWKTNPCVWSQSQHRRNGRQPHHWSTTIVVWI
ncbi:hypothetical protein Hanom_Chr02g00136321 [Helianthus anomalus]